MQLHKALCKLLWVSHKARVTHSLPGTGAKGGGQTNGSQGLSPGPLPVRFPAPHTEHQERREVLHFP